MNQGKAIYLKTLVLTPVDVLFILGLLGAHKCGIFRPGWEGDPGVIQNLWGKQRENKSCGQSSRGSHLASFKSSLLMGQSNSQLEKVCVPSKAQHSQGNPKQPEAKQPEKFIGWSCEEKPYGKEENKGERRFFCYFGLVSCNQLVPHVWFTINTVWSPQQIWLLDRTQLLPPNKANWKYKTIPQHHLPWQNSSAPAAFNIGAEH